MKRTIEWHERKRGEDWQCDAWTFIPETDRRDETCSDGEWVYGLTSSDTLTVITLTVQCRPGVRPHGTDVTLHVIEDRPTAPITRCSLHGLACAYDGWTSSSVADRLAELIGVRFADPDMRFWTELELLFAGLDAEERGKPEFLEVWNRRRVREAADSAPDPETSPEPTPTTTPEVVSDAVPREVSSRLCLRCGNAMLVSQEDALYASLPGVVLVGMIVHRCAGCCELEVGIPAIEHLTRMVAVAVMSSRYGGFTRNEIRFFRKAMGWNPMPPLDAPDLHIEMRWTGSAWSFALVG